MAKPPRAVAYLRVSSEEQAESGAGLGSQLESCGAHAGRHSLQLVASHTDAAVSGATPFALRPGLRAAVAALGPGDFLVVARRDRLGRDPMVVAEIEATVAAVGARVASAAGEGTESDDPSSILLRRIIDAIAENGRLVIKERTRAALAFRKASRRRAGQLPYGLTLAPEGAGPLSKSGRPSAVVEAPEDLAALELVAALRGEGWSLRSIAAELTRRGLPTKNGGAAWRASTVHRLAGRVLPPPADLDSPAVYQAPPAEPENESE